MQLSVPSSLNLLPGQFHMLNEAVEMEKQRMKTPPAPDGTQPGDYVSLQADMPVWVLTKCNFYYTDFSWEGILFQLCRCEQHQTSLKAVATLWALLNVSFRFH